MVILGIDPGLGITGFGVIDAAHDRLQLLAAGDIRPPKQQPLASRLGILHDALADVMVQQQPAVCVLEQLYTHHEHVTTAAMMAHARGVACLVAQQQQVPLVEYPPNRVKKALTGHGIASKEQVAQMVAYWIGRRDPSWSWDVTDALALAIAHAHMQSQHQFTQAPHLVRGQGAGGRGRGK
jgi:crossover junction endodeoxyribonuclease RuvC